MDKNFQKLLDILNVKDVRFIDSHEALLSLDGWSGDDDKVHLNNAISIAKNDPVRDESRFVVHPRYEMTFAENEKEFFKAVYILEVMFESEKPDDVMKLLEDPDLKKLFFKKQLNHTLWPILRSRIINAFANHSLKPVVLPWLPSLKK